MTVLNKVSDIVNDIYLLHDYNTSDSIDKLIQLIDELSDELIETRADNVELQIKNVQLQSELARIKGLTMEYS